MTLERFHRGARSELLSELASTRLDVLVIGGGITGASVFRDAALRGLRVGLVEARDFASGTSSRSSKLIHGGLRYLKTLGLGLARESCRERNLQIRLNKRLVRPVPFLVPLYRDRGPSRLTTRVGMIGYEVLSGLANHRWHRFLNREETLLLAPGIPDSALDGSCVYYDAAVSDNRWTLETVKDGVRHGGVALNYAPVEALRLDAGRVRGARLRDQLSGATRDVRATRVINACGVFADAIRRMEDPEAPRRIRLSKGTHLVFDDADVPLEVTTVFSSPLDGRPMFLVKRDRCFLYGTSDDWEDADPGAPVPGERDVRYLLESLGAFLAEAGLTAERVRFVYSGFRPLLVRGDDEVEASAASREDWVEVSRGGLVSVMGGKLTTARVMAKRVLDPIARELGKGLECRTHRLSIGGSNEEVAEGLAHWIKREPAMKDYFRTLFLRYGVDADSICAEARRIHRGEHADPGAEPIRAEVEYVCRNEMTCTVEDLMDRRAGYLHWSTEKRLERLRYGARVIARELGLDTDGFEAQFARYRERLRRFHSLPAIVEPAVHAAG